MLSPFVYMRVPILICVYAYVYVYVCTEISKAIMQFKDHKSRVVRAAIAQLLPVWHRNTVSLIILAYSVCAMYTCIFSQALAEFCPDAFACRHLSEALEVLAKCAKTPELRAQALFSTGQLCLALTHHLSDRTDDLLAIIQESLLSSYGPNTHLALTTGTRMKPDLTAIQYANSEIVAEALKCIANLVQSLGADIHPKISVLLDLMFLSGTYYILRCCHFYSNKRIIHY